MAPLKTLVLATATAFALFGCSFSGAGSSGKSVTMADAFDLDIFGPHEDDLHPPYVSGARFGISVLATGNQQGWTLSSSDPNVMRVTSSLVGGTATVTAGSPGHATLSVLDSTGALLDSHAVTVEVHHEIERHAKANGLDDRRRAGFEPMRRFLVGGAREGHAFDHVTAPLIGRHCVQQPVLAVKHPDTGWAVKLMARKDIEIGIERLHVDRPVCGRLATVDQRIDGLRVECRMHAHAGWRGEPGRRRELRGKQVGVQRSRVGDAHQVARRRRLCLRLTCAPSRGRSAAREGGAHV